MPPPVVAAAALSDQDGQSSSVLDAVHRASLRQVSLADELHRTKLKYRSASKLPPPPLSFLISRIFIPPSTPLPHLLAAVVKC